MGEVQRLVDELERAYNGDAWHGPSVSALLQGMSAAQAAARPARLEHSIWQQVLHLTAWKRVVLGRLRGESISELAPEANWPAVADVSETAWEQALQQMATMHRDLLRVVRELVPERLDAPLGKGSTVSRTLHGVAQHDAYHGGQIALTRKLS